MVGLSVFPGGVDQIPNNVTNAIQQANLHPNLHNTLADAMTSVQTALLPGGGLSLADHLAASNPHPQYLTQAAGDARYAQTSAGYITQAQGDTRYLQLAGGTLTGLLTLSGPPTQNLHAATKAYVDSNSQTQAAADARYLQLTGGSLANGTNPVTLNIYNTISGGNTEYASLGWSSSIFSVSNQHAGTGAQRSMRITGWSSIQLGPTIFDGWQVDISGNLNPVADASYNIGNTNNAPTTVYAYTLITNTVQSKGTTLQFYVNGAVRWQITNTGAIWAQTDNTMDIGTSSGNRPRNIYAATQMFAPSGFFAAQTLYGGGMISTSTNTLDIRNGTSGQGVFIYNTFTDIGNYERLALIWSGNNVFVQSQVLGTGVARDLTIGTQSASSLIIATNNSQRWFFPATGHLYAITDNAIDIGASGANRPRNLYLGGNANINGNAVIFGSASSFGLSVTGGTTFGGNVIFLTDNAYDIGAAATSRARNIYVAGAIVNRTKAGVPVDTDVTNPVDGMMIINTSANTIYFRSSGAWQQSGAGVTWPLVAPAGSNTAPSYTFTSDTNTGIYDAGPDQLAIAANGGQAALFDGNGVTLYNTIGIGVPYSTTQGITIQPSFQSGTQQLGIYLQPGFYGSAARSVWNIYAYWDFFSPSPASLADAGTLWIDYPYMSTNSGSITNYYGIQIKNQGMSNITNAYGIWIENQSGATAKNLGLYNGGTTSLVGNVSIGSTAGNPAGNVGLANYATLSGSSQYGAWFWPAFSSAATQEADVLAITWEGASATFSTTNTSAITINQPNVHGSNSITRMRGVYINNQGGNSLIANAYGLYIENVTGASTANIGIYNAGSSILMDRMALAGTSLSTFAIVNMSMSSALASLTSSNLMGIDMNIYLPTTVTSIAAGIRVGFGAAATAFTISNIYGVQILQPAISGPTITNMYGLNVANVGRSSVVNAYGVYIAQVSGATTVNISLYSAGTNQLGSNTTIGTGVAPVSTTGPTLTVGTQPLNTAAATVLSLISSFNSNTVTSGTMLSIAFQTQAFAYTMANGYGVNVLAPSLGSGSAVTNLYGMYVGNMGAAGISNAYGLFVTTQNGASGDNGNVLYGDTGVGLVTNAQLATSTTTGFFWIPSMAGPPTAQPARANNLTGIGRVAMVYDSADNRIYINIGGTTWHYWNMSG